MRKRGWVGAVVVCISLFSSVCQAKSVFVISEHTSSTVTIFDIAGSGLVEQDSDWIPDNGSGAIDLAVNDDDSVLFSSYDGENVIEVVDTGTLEPVHTEVLGGDIYDEIAGLAYCDTYDWLLCAERYDTQLRVLAYDAAHRNFSQNMLIEVPGADAGLVGICFDETQMRLYVSQNSSSVKCYQLGKDLLGEPTLTYIEDIPVAWNGQDKIAVGIAVYNDQQGTKYLYSAGYDHEAGQDQHPYLIRTDINEPNSPGGRLGAFVGAGVYAAGIAADRQTGYAYVTTVPTVGAESSVRIYDPLNWVSDPNECTPLAAVTQGINGPAGLAIGTYKYRNRLQVYKGQISPEPPACVQPEDLVTYQIAFQPGKYDETNVVVRDKLPLECDFVSADPNTGVYEAEYHTYTWDVGFVEGIDPNNPPADPNLYFSITMRVNDAAEPAGEFTNIAQAESDEAFAEDRVDTCVACWTPPGGDPNIIYVDGRRVFERTYLALLNTVIMQNLNTGTSWEDAYSDLNDALARADKECGSEIWVAGGLYQPGPAEDDRFHVPSGVAVYGGFCGNETSRDQRNRRQYETVLSGYIDETTRNNTVVQMGNNSILDGFTVQEAGEKGIDGSDESSTVANCIIKDCIQTGIYSKNGNLTIQWCEVLDNGRHAVYHEGSNYTLIAENCRIHDNGYDGIHAEQSVLSVLNSLIYQNGSEDDYYGINLVNPSSSPTLRNNTIVQNVNAGIRFVGSHPPAIVNCIVYYNGDNSEGPPLIGLDPDNTAHYSCIYDCNSVNGNFPEPPQFAYTTEPNDFPVVGNYHLAYDSRCVDAGDDDGYDETDIDGEPRVYGIWVDVGADEAYSCDDDLTEDDIYNPLDFSADGLVNFADFGPVAAAWLSHNPDDPVCDPNAPGYVSDPNDPDYISETQKVHWDPVCNLDDTGDSAYAIDLADLDVFCDEWLWTACWKQNQFEIYGTYSMMSGGGMFMEMLPMETFSTESVYAEPIQTVIPAQECHPGLRAGAGIQFEENSYTNMPTDELISLVTGIDKILDDIDSVIAEDTENLEEWLEIKDFLESVITDIKASRQ